MIAQFQITSSEAHACGLWPIGFRFSYPTLMYGGATREPSVYASFSGPPGGPLLLQITQSSSTDASRLQASLGSQVLGYGDLRDFTPVTTTAVAGSDHPTIGFIAGQSLARVHVCIIQIAVSPHAALRLTFLVGKPSGNPDVAQILSHECFMPVVQTFELL